MVVVVDNNDDDLDHDHDHEHDDNDDHDHHATTTSLLPTYLLQHYKPKSRPSPCLEVSIETGTQSSAEKQS